MLMRTILDFNLDEPGRIPIYGYCMPDGRILTLTARGHPGDVVTDSETGETSEWVESRLRIAHLIRTPWMTMVEDEG